MTPPRLSLIAFAASAALAALGSPPQVQAQSLTIGSPNVAVADPLVPRPPTTPCVVTLYTNETFAFDFSFHHYTFTPPPGCPGPWQKVVLSADVDVTAGRQFDRTVVVWLGGAVIYFGTTEEPSATVAPSWHVERDLTDYSALFKSPQDGYLILGNVVNSTYTGIYHTSATLYFYPPSEDENGGGTRPDQVLPLLPNNLAYLASSTDKLSATFTLPMNIERLFLDVYAQSQASDEFWFFDLPTDVAAMPFNQNNPYLGNSGNTAFKEAEVTIDGQPAGVAPIYPWIYTGGGDPYLWRPIPGVQTLSFDPYRVDLTPFAGALSDGAPHTVAVSVFNANDHFSTAASLLVYLDHGSQRVTGGVTTNTLGATPPVNVSENLTTAADGTVSGPVTVTSYREFTIAGTATTSHGTVTTRIDTRIAFSNAQRLFAAPNTSARQDVFQDTFIDKVTTRTGEHGPPVVLHEQREYPLTYHYDIPFAADGSCQYINRIDQEFSQEVSLGAEDNTGTTARLDNHRLATADRHYSGACLASTLVDATATASQTYRYADPFGACYSRTITAAKASAAVPGALTGVTDGTACPGDVNHLGWHDPFADFASRLFGATVKLLP